LQLLLRVTPLQQCEDFWIHLLSEEVLNGVAVGKYDAIHWGIGVLGAIFGDGETEGLAFVHLFFPTVNRSFSVRVET
jgi:hypothetical protein